MRHRVSTVERRVSAIQHRDLIITYLSEALLSTPLEISFFDRIAHLIISNGVNDFELPFSGLQGSKHKTSTRGNFSSFTFWVFLYNRADK